MVYSQDFLDSTLDNINNVIALDAGAGASSGPTVTVLFKGSGVHTVGGPTPFVEISTSVENNSVGLPESSATRITLNGKIVRPQAATPTGSGISHVLSGIKSLNDLFKPEEVGEFKIQCSSSDIYSVTGVKVVSIDIAKTSDNWVQTADYTIVLEHNKSHISGYSVKNLVDTWSIESLEDYTYSSFAIPNINQKQEYDNPNLKPTAPGVGNLQPGGQQTGSSSGGVSPNTSSATLDVVSIPQFKVSHTVGAVGVPSGTGSTSGLSNSAYFNAMSWVINRLGLSASSSTPSGIISINNNNNGSPPYHLGTGYFYNHLRTTNANISEGRFEVVDTWLAMPTGIGYVEDYTIELSTDEKYIHTVSVKGEVRGLSLSTQSGEMQVISGTPPKLAGPYNTGTAGPSHKVPDAFSSNSSAGIGSNKYQNAGSGWIYDIKPYLYRRACVAMSTSDRTKGYINPLGAGNTSTPPNNPVYSKHGLLNVIPISTSESHNTRKGIISYDYTFNNKFTYISGVISENISFEDTGPTDVISEAFVLGRALGPVLQNLGTKTTSRKSATVEVTVVPPSSMAGFFMQNSDCPLWTGGTVYTTISGIIEGLKPFGDRPSTMFGSSTVPRGGGQTGATGQVYTASDTQSWDPTNGRFTKTVSWIYQQCSTDKHWLDH